VRPEKSQRQHKKITEESTAKHSLNTLLMKVMKEGELSLKAQFESRELTLSSAEYRLKIAKKKLKKAMFEYLATSE